MRPWSKTTLKTLMVPGGALLLCVAALVHSGWLTLALPAITYLFYCALIGGALLAWRFHASRIFLALLVLFLAQQAVTLFLAEHSLPGTPAWTAVQWTILLVPMNFVFIALMQERGFTVPAMAPFGLFLFVQSVVVVVVFQSVDGSSPMLSHSHHVATAIALPSYALLVFAIAGTLLLGRVLLTRKPADGALFWSLVAFFLAVHFLRMTRVSAVYAATAACILAISIIENSYLLAYHDELTSLPSRRAFNDALLRLQDPYSIAVVDIDHFKRFNDTYGHDTGDQVLQLVATRLARVTGGGQAYRCGGEEFTILFPGKTVREVVDHLEELRAAIEASAFRMRGCDRRQVPRGPDRRNHHGRGRPSKGRAIRELADGKSSTLSVTVSIGVATSKKEFPHPDLVLKAADQALYRAKANGRNQIETASAGRRERAKAAGIA